MGICKSRAAKTKQSSPNKEVEDISSHGLSKTKRKQEQKYNDKIQIIEAQIIDDDEYYSVSSKSAEKECTAESDLDNKPSKDMTTSQKKKMLTKPLKKHDDSSASEYGEDSSYEEDSDEVSSSKEEENSSLSENENEEETNTSRKQLKEIQNRLGSSSSNPLKRKIVLDLSETNTKLKDLKKITIDITDDKDQGKNALEADDELIFFSPKKVQIVQPVAGENPMPRNRWMEKLAMTSKENVTPEPINEIVDSQ